MTYLFQHKYFYREVAESEIPSIVTLRDGDEIIFGNHHPHSSLINLPDPDFCNLKLSIARVLHASGAAEAIEAFETDFKELDSLRAVHFGSDYVSDDLLMESLYTRAGKFDRQ